MAIKIGNKKIKKEVDEGDRIILTIDDGTVVPMSKKLYDLVKGKESNGDITDTVTHIITAKFIQELADYDLDYYFVDLVATRMQTYLHNLREEKIAKAFDCQSSREIKIRKLL